MPDPREQIDRAAITIISVIHMIEEEAEARATQSELIYEIEFPDGSVEVWSIVVGRKSS